MDTRRSLPLLRRHRHHHRRRRRLLRGLNFIQRSSLLTGKKGEHVFRTHFPIHSSLSAFSSYVFMGYARMGRRLFHGATRSLDYADSCSRRRLVTAIQSLNFSLRFARVFFLYSRFSPPRFRRPSRFLRTLVIGEHKLDSFITILKFLFPLFTARFQR